MDTKLDTNEPGGNLAATAREIGAPVPQECPRHQAEEKQNRWRKNVRRRSSSAASQDDDKATQTNAEPALAKSKLADQQDCISKLEAKNAASQSKLDEIDDIIECDDPECTAEDTSQRSRMSSRTATAAEATMTGLRAG